MSARSEHRLPAYVSYVTWNRLMHSLGEFMPSAVDSSVYSDSGFSGSDTKKLRSALRYLNLVDEHGKPSDELRTLVKVYQDEAETKSKAKLLEDILTRSYPFLKDDEFDLASASWRQLESRFDSLGASGSLQTQCISFFLHLAADAGLGISPHLSSRTKSGLGRYSAARKVRKKQKQDNKRAEVPESQAGMLPGSLNAMEIARVLNIDPTVAGLLRLLPHVGVEWSASEKKRFKAAFEAVLDAVYPDEEGQ